MVTTVTGKNQVTLPADIVKELGLIPGVQIDWSIGPEGTLIGRKKRTRAELARDLRGFGLKYLPPGADPTRHLHEERAKDLEGE